MKRFASTTVRDAESHYNFPRAIWDDDASALADDAPVVFFMTDMDDGKTYLADSNGHMCFHGSASDVPEAWLEDDEIRFYFGLTRAEFIAKYCG